MQAAIFNTGKLEFRIIPLFRAENFDYETWQTVATTKDHISPELLRASVNWPFVSKQVYVAQCPLARAQTLLYARSAQAEDGEDKQRKPL